GTARTAAASRRTRSRARPARASSASTAPPPTTRGRATSSSSRPSPRPPTRPRPAPGSPSSCTSTATTGSSPAARTRSRARSAACTPSDATKRHTAVPPSRTEMLEAFIARSPNDPFPRYGLALEHKNAGRLEEAWTVFTALMNDHPTYTAAYLHAGNTAVALGRPDDARTAYT